MNISEVDFVEAIDRLKKQQEHDSSFGKLMEIAFPGSHAPIYDNSNLWETVIRLLEIATNDTAKTIEWWIYEKDFGSNQEKNISWKEEGKEVFAKLDTAKDLYYYLKEIQK